MARVILGTRGSDLARWQAAHVADLLGKLHPGLEIEQQVIRTHGDRDHTVPIEGLQGRGVFVREIERALLDERVDLAVHSLKDMPTEQPQGLVVAAVPARHDPRDALLTLDGRTLQELPGGATVATGSYRRRCQLLAVRPDLRVVPVRGNVPTRVERLRERRFDALVLAVAGIERLGIRSVPVRPLEPEVCLPAAGQGALGVETRVADAETRRRAAALDHPASSRAVAAERAFLHRLGGGCLAPATAYAVVEDERLSLRAVVGDADGCQLLRDAAEGPLGDAEKIGAAVAERMLEAGAGELLDAARRAAGVDGV